MNDQVRPSLMGDPNMLLPIKVLGLRSNQLNALTDPSTADVYKDGKWTYQFICTIGQLLTKSLEDLSNVSNLGQASIQKIEDTLAARGYILGEARGQVTGIECSHKDNLRRCYQIPHDVPTPTDWVEIPGRTAVKVLRGLGDRMLTKQFNLKTSVFLPYEVNDPEKREAIQAAVQKAFEIAVGHEVALALDPTKKPNLNGALKKGIPGFSLLKAAYGCPARMDVELTASEQITDIIKPGALSRIAYSFDERLISSIVMSVLGRDNKPS